ncbi:serpin family protein [Flavonifractor hominis]|uniref:Serpin family protein n=1 Tax=Flavonifractor hominis TaxID=3133178 RepID=A0ABV1EQ71_9FIRM
MKGRILPLILTLLLLTGCAAGPAALEPAQSVPPVEARADAALDAALGDFGLELLRQTRQEGENTFLSPLSVLLCLSMTANGAAGETLSQFEDLLGGELDALNANAASLLADYEDELDMAGSLWLDGRAQVEDPFVGRCADTYGAEVFAADFTGDATRRDINAWIEKHTGGHIKDAVAALKPETMLAIVNALYFEGEWAETFRPEQTEQDYPFHPADGSEAAVAMMNSGGRTERYLSGGGAEGVLLPYKDSRLAFLALLPPEGTGLGDWLEELDSAALSELMDGAEERYLVLRLPKFEAMWKRSLVEPLKAMGLTDAFDPGLADLSAMGTGPDGAPLYLSAVEHGAGIQVDEQGTKAYAFTIAAPGAGASSVQVVSFQRPFLYGIVDLERGIPLFLGTFEAP